MNWMDMTLTEFQNSLSSKKPTPGGGTASAVALGQSAGLVAMVANLTIDNDKWQDGWKACEEALVLANEVMTKSGELANKDSEAFDQVMACFKMPKSTDEDKLLRRDAIRNATLYAAEIPYLTATISLQLLETMQDIVEDCNANAISDVGVAALLANAGCKGALFNVEINLNSLPDNYGESMRKNVESINNKCRAISKKIMHVVKARM